ncbi:MAG TPA: putative peptidoglycan glycosyltransferase FtsW [Candidatus Paceibacterota bacterium]|nr:putative peptidoglycan glycosyltransferase FtsW [Candidatus Paceibacterota bacterium]
MRHPIDRTLLFFTVTLVIVGFFIFTSASLGLLARDGARFSSVAFNQVLFGIIGGSVALFIASKIHYRVWRQHAFYIGVATMLLTLAVFLPHIGASHGGARRWLDLGFISFQPSEFLKFGFVVYMATWLSGMKHHIKNFKKGTLPFVALLVGVALPLLAQPDTDTFLMIATSCLAMFIVAGGSIRDVALIGVAGIVLIIILMFTRPYIKDRIEVFLNPSLDPQGAGYQVKQSLIAIGSGGVVGRGYGQSIQKFEYLPEPIGDSVFAVFAEEFGFIGSLILIGLFGGFTMRGYRIATHAPDLFGMLLVVGIMTIIVAQIFLNIAAMLALAPLSGLPLPFISHGGTALFTTLAAVGVVLNISTHQKRVLT